jgi:hypothetical protein
MMTTVYIIEKKKQGSRVRWVPVYLSLLEYEVEWRWDQMLENLYQQELILIYEPEGQVSREREEELRQKALAKRDSYYRLRQEGVPLSPESLVVGRWYRGHKAHRISSDLHPDHGRYPDRQIIRRGCRAVQYDGPEVKTGSRYPEVSIPGFLLWAAADVSDEWGDESDSVVERWVGLV